MDEAELIEEIDHQESLLKIQRRNLRALELQIAQHALDVPIHLQTAREDLRVEISRLERMIRDLRARLRRAQRRGK
jgi:predicted  nucleic acid-binding Zn-ribbon protein